MCADKVRLNLDLPRSLEDRIARLAQEDGITKTELLRKAFALFLVSHEAKQQGHRLAIVSKDLVVLREIVGL